MRLKSLVIQGFKSFAEKAIIEFESGLTGIVGPNGCGKSNVVDAIRWVMGEQSPRSLRGSEMLDIVFGGTERRAASGFARVQMLLESDESSAGASEVEITRRLTRSGESQYMLNRSRCRLRDITELLLDHGLGSRDYSVIEQGKVDRLLSLKPQERLQIFEEAAGVRLFQVQRERTEAKLAKTLEKLDRVADIHREVNAQVERLAVQAAAARRHEELGGELDRARTALYQIRLDRWTKTRESAETDLAAVDRSDFELTAALTDLESGLSLAEETLGQRQAAVSGVESSLRDLEGALNAGRTEQKLLTESVPELHAQMNRAQEEHDALVLRVSELQAELLRVSDEETRFAESLDRFAAEQDAAETVQKRQQVEVQRIEKEAATARQRYVALHSRHATVTGERKRLEEGLEKEERFQEKLSKSLFELLDEERKLVENQGGLNRERTELDLQIGRVGEEIAALDERRKIVSRRLVEARTRVHTLEKQFESLAARKKALDELSRSLDGVGEGPGSVLRWARDRGLQPALLLQCLDLPPELEPALTAALGDRLEAVVAPSLSWAFEAIDALRGSLSPTTFVIRDRLSPEIASSPSPSGDLLSAVRWLPGADPRLASVLRRFRLVRDRQAAIEALARIESSDIVVTEAGESFDAEGLMTAGTERSRAGTNLRRVQEARRLGDKLAAVEAERVEAAAELERIVEEDEHLEITLASLLATSKTREAERGRLNVEVEKLDFRLQRLNLDRGAAEQQLAQLGAQLVQSRERTQELLAELGRLEASIAAEERAERGRTEALAEERGRLQGLEAGLMTRQVEARTLRDRMKAVSVQAIDLQKRRAEAETGARRWKAQIDEGTAKLETVHKRLRHLQSEDARLELDRQGVAAALEEARKDSQAIARGAASQRGKMTELRRKRDKLLHEQSRLRVKVTEATMALESVAATRAQLPAELPTELPMKRGEPELVTEIADLEVKQAALGPLNFAAVAEHEANRARLEFLETQRADLDKSVADLRAAIEELSARSEGQFREAFASIRTNFKNLFATVLPEGSADLVLTEENGEFGIEVHAQPPGKKLRSLELLSGGEKALVTILLLVSMFLHRPSPFCILDEVDAALDDVNNRRFSELLKTMSQSTQVLVVTHSKRTIEACDTLFGVTMNEPGVSKLVSVRLQGSSSSAGKS